jgi:hypothetical protein
MITHPQGQVFILAMHQAFTSLDILLPEFLSTLTRKRGRAQRAPYLALIAAFASSLVALAFP